ncbi:CBS domain-containing protein [Halovenus sp. WSH3]|uniref:CBS domain-containing protein n=1 Tax=Halovenus carboxidivorans TaxID=2692199 RepID=A0A6B0T235_9EURY|nr:CBS domain-containing protein [Halovenus carboxidivorans]MXR52124.1 CBS domain-containing protein [Halovenus carboxidivorans]
MEDIFVGRLMSSDVVTVTPGESVEFAAELLRDNNIGSVVVVDENEKLRGILTSTDFVHIVAENDPKDESSVMDYMTTDVVTIGVQDSVQEAADRLITYDVHHLPVVDDEEHVVGMLSTTDLAAYLSGVEDPTPTYSDPKQAGSS